MMKTIIAASIPCNCYHEQPGVCLLERVAEADASLQDEASPLPQRGLEFQLRSRFGLRTDSAVLRRRAASLRRSRQPEQPWRLGWRQPQWRALISNEPPRFRRDASDRRLDLPDHHSAHRAALAPLTAKFAPEPALDPIPEPPRVSAPMHTAGPKQGDRNAQNHYHNDRCWTRCDDLDPAIFCGPYSRHRCKLGRHHWQRVQPRQRSRQYRSRRQQRPEPLGQQLHRVSAGGDWCRRICQTPALVDRLNPIDPASISP